MWLIPFSSSTCENLLTRPCFSVREKKRVEADRKEERAGIREHMDTQGATRRPTESELLQIYLKALHRPGRAFAPTILMDPLFGVEMKDLAIRLPLDLLFHDRSPVQLIAFVKQRLGAYNHVSFVL